MAKVKPILILALIAAVISGLVIGVHDLTYVNTTNIVTDKQAEALTQIYGGTKDDYEVVPLVDENDISTDIANKIDNAGLSVAKIFKKKSDESLAFEFLVKGYKNGFDIMVGVKDGKVEGVAIVSVGEETPGLGTKTNDAAWLGNFKGIEADAEIVKTAPAANNQVQAVTSATYSSKGVATAVNNALKVYKAIGGEAQ